MSRITLGFVGDIYAFQPTLAKWRSNPACFNTALHWLRQADVRFANLEAPLVDCGTPLFSTGVRLFSPPSVTELLRQLQLDIVGIANNHMNDYGPEGVLSTLEFLEKAQIHAIGAGRDLSGALQPRFIEKNGTRLAYLAACDDEGGGAARRTPGVSLLHPPTLLAQVREVRDKADVVVVSIHTGLEFCPVPEPFFHNLAHELIDGGATVVVGHHPHVPQGIERRGAGLIAYSLGDFLFDLPRPPGDLTAEQARPNSMHGILHVHCEAGRVSDYQMHWLRRDESGVYHDSADAAWGREFQELCQVLTRPADEEHRVRAMYRALFKENVYYFPLAYFREFWYDGGSRALRGFLWWLTTLRREPKRRMLQQGLLSWVQLLRHRVGESFAR